MGRPVIDKVRETMSMQRRGLGADTGDSVLAGPVYVDRVKPPTACSLCHKPPGYVRLEVEGLWECSHLECPLRKRLTAQPVRRPT